MTTSDVIQKIIEYLILLGVGGVGVEIVRSRFQKKKMGADYADVISASAVRLLEPLEKRIAQLEAQLEHTQAQLGSTQIELAAAHREIRLLREESQQERREIARDAVERRDRKRRQS